MRFSTYASNGKEKDYESGFHYYGARYYWSELLTGWLSVDPMADKYPSISPYNYCAWNPIKLLDPDGREIDLSAIYNANGERRKGCESFCKIFEFFAKHKIGQKYLSKYAKAGQIIAGHTYTEDGVFHKKGINLKIEYKSSNYLSEPRAGYTVSKKNNDGKLNTNIIILTETNDRDSKVKLLEAFCHEFFIHAYQDAKEFSKNSLRWISNNADKQHKFDINTNHLMRDCTIPIITDYCHGNKNKVIEIINQESAFKYKDL